MIHYILEDRDGKIMQRGQCATQDEIPVLDGLMIRIITEDDPCQPAAAPESYRMSRAMDYPSVGDQVDVMWKLLEQVGVVAMMPEAKEMLARVRAVKDKYPKQ